MRRLFQMLAARLAGRDAEAMPGGTSQKDSSQRVLDTFMSADYALDKIAACLVEGGSGGDGRVLGIWGADELRRVMARFEGMLLARGLGEEIRDSLSGVFDMVEYPLTQLALYLGGRRSEIENDAIALAFVDYLRDRFRELRSLGSEIRPDHYPRVA